MLFDQPFREKLLEVTRRERQAYGHYDLDAQVGYRDPMTQLVMTMISHRTTRAEEKQAFDNMWKRFGSWEAIQNADTDAVAEELAPARFPERKAPNIQKTLAKIYAERGAYNINFLADLSARDGLGWLMSLPGVGVKTASLVLLFCFKKPVMPVDTHVHRIAKRLGVIGENMSAEKAHTRLLEILPDDPELLFQFHRATLTHGQRVCTYYDPACDRCPLTDLCDDYAARSGRTAQNAVR